jgi:hypothetical protein
MRPSVLCRFRRKLLDHGLERALLERLVNAALSLGGAHHQRRCPTHRQQPHPGSRRGEGDLRAYPRRHQKAAEGFIGYTPAKRGGLEERLRWYVDPDAPEKPQSIDWSDPEGRAAHLKEIVEDAREALLLAQQRVAACRRDSRGERSRRAAL